MGFSAERWTLRPMGKGRAEFADKDLLLRVPEGAEGGLDAVSAGTLSGDFVMELHNHTSDWSPKPEDRLKITLRVSGTPGADGPALVFSQEKSVRLMDAFTIAGDTREWGLPKGNHTDLVVRRRGQEWTIYRFDRSTGQFRPMIRVTKDLPQNVHLEMSVRKTGASPVELLLMIGKSGVVLPD